eukprot:TRINITY_DN2146_c0_g1_i1.p1 TRINITY_DN2146_c0_g1~~TRINITY_DN2146_c0_g1_i1.p1  ORF type:complete len:287 (-),score=44.57 TRINITY_DN2146_c0_g1_i1:455-1315(-)
MAFIPRAYNEDFPEDQYKTVKCKFFELGMCKRGEECTYAHGLSEIRSKPNYTHTRPCFEFILKGKCANGNQCGFAHFPEQLHKSESDALYDPPMLMSRTSTKGSASSSSISTTCSIPLPEPLLQDASFTPVSQPSLRLRSVSEDDIVPLPSASSTPRAFMEDASLMPLLQPRLEPRSFAEDATIIPWATTRSISSLHPPLQPSAAAGGPSFCAPAWELRKMEGQAKAWPNVQQQVEECSLQFQVQHKLRELVTQLRSDAAEAQSSGRMQQNLRESQGPVILARLEL